MVKFKGLNIYYQGLSLGIHLYDIKQGLQKSSNDGVEILVNFLSA